MLYRFRVLEGGGGSGHCNQDRWPDFELGATADFQGCRLSEGAHVFVAQAQDAAGNAETTQLEHHFTVDLTGPTTVITQDPGEEVTGSRATFEFAATDNYTPDAQLTFSWRIYPDGTGDGVEWSAPSTARVAVPVDLAPGRYEFAVRSFDLAGNTDEIPPTHVFDVYASTDKVPPVLEITSGPEGAWNQTSATFEWTATDDESPEARVLCGYRALPAMPAWSDPPAFVRTAMLSDLVPGTDYRFEVRCEDESGNQSNASRRFRIELDAEAPDETEAPDEAETPVEAEQPPVEAEQPPVEIEQPPTETETPVEPDAEEAVIEPDAEAEVATEDTVDRPDQRPRNNAIPGDGGGCTCSTTPAPVGAEVLWLLLLIGWVVLRRRT